MTLKNGAITQYNGVMSPFLKGHGDSRYIYIYAYCPFCNQGILWGTVALWE